jgi:hypothetical protein
VKHDDALRVGPPLCNQRQIRAAYYCGDGGFTPRTYVLHHRALLRRVGMTANCRFLPVVRGERMMLNKPEKGRHEAIVGFEDRV